jgi:hypothetical protein
MDASSETERPAEFGDVWFSGLVQGSETWALIVHRKLNVRPSTNTLTDRPVYRMCSQASRLCQHLSVKRPASEVPWKLQLPAFPRPQ